MIKVSAPGKIHFLGEHTVVYGKPALLAAVDLRISVILIPPKAGEGSLDSFQNKSGDSSLIAQNDNLKKVIEPIIKKYLKIKTIPPYHVEISSQIPIGSGMGSSAAVSASFIAALLTYLGHKWDLNLVNELTYEAEKVFNGNPSGGDNSTVVYGGLVWFRKETPDLKILQPLPFKIPTRLAKNFILINTGKPKETTKEMVEIVKELYDKKPQLVSKLLDNQEELTKKLLLVIKNGDENKLMDIIKAGERNLENMGVVSPYAKSIIRKIEENGGAAKICGAGGKTKAAGILLCYHSKPSVIDNIAKSHNLGYFKTTLGVEGLRQE